MKHSSVITVPTGMSAPRFSSALVSWLMSGSSVSRPESLTRRATLCGGERPVGDGGPADDDDPVAHVVPGGQVRDRREDRV
jgi:hypothetical protein